MIFSYTRLDGIDAIISADACISENHVATSVVSQNAVDRKSNVTDHVREENDSITLDLMFSNTPIRQPLDGLTGGATGSVQELRYSVSQRVRARVGPPVLVDPGLPPQRLRSVAGPLIASTELTSDVGPFPTGTAFNLLANVSAPGSPPRWEPSREEESSSVVTAQTFQFSGAFDRARLVYEELLYIRRNKILVRIDTSLRTYENMVLQGINPTRDALTGNVLRVTVDAVQVRIVNSDTVQITQPLQTRGQKTKNKGTAFAVEANEVEAEKSSFSWNLIRGS